MRLVLAAAVAALLLWQDGTLQGAADALRCHGASWTINEPSTSGRGAR